MDESLVCRLAQTNVQHIKTDKTNVCGSITADHDVRLYAKLPKSRRLALVRLQFDYGPFNHLLQKSMYLPKLLFPKKIERFSASFPKKGVVHLARDCHLQIVERIYPATAC